MLEEYEKGNYIVVGGDWNQCPPDFKPNTFRPEITPDEYYQINVPTDFYQKAGNGLLMKMFQQTEN